MSSTHTISARGISATFEFECGFVAELLVERDGELLPSHLAELRRNPDGIDRASGQGSIAVPISGTRREPCRRLAGQWRAARSALLACGREPQWWGIQEACAWSLRGQTRSDAANPLNDAGIPTSIILRRDGSVSVSTALGALPLSAGLFREVGLAISADAVDLGSIKEPFDSEHFGT